MKHPKYWYFINLRNRNDWLGQAISRGLWVEPVTIENARVSYRFIAESSTIAGRSDSVYVGRLYTVEDIDRRKRE